MQPLTLLCLPATARSHSLPGTRGLEFSADRGLVAIGFLALHGAAKGFPQGRGRLGWRGIVNISIFPCHNNNVGDIP